MQQQSSQPLRILVVEDDAPTLAAMTQILRTLKFIVQPARTIAEAYANLADQQILIVDLHLPDGSGADIIRKIRAEGRAMRIIVITSAADDDLHRMLDRSM